MPLPDCSVALIAGGKSKRFGSPKYLAKIGNRRLIDLALDLAGQISSDIMIISAVPEIKENAPFPVFEDVFPQCGPLAGIHSALLHSKRDWLAILPVDMPLLKAEFYQLLWQKRNGNVPVVARTEKGIEPMVSLWPRSALPKIEQALLRQEFKILAVLEQISFVPVPFPKEQSIHFFNINFEKDLQLIQFLTGQGDNDA